MGETGELVADLLLHSVSFVSAGITHSATLLGWVTGQGELRGPTATRRDGWRLTG